MCSIPGCDRKVQARGWCAGHYAKWKKYGDPTVVKQSQLHGKTLRERFEQYTRTSSGCWLWIGHRDPNGYGRLNVNGQPLLAHRLSWQLHNGDMGDSYVLHKCDNPQCVNPTHLFLGTQSENCDDMWSKGRAKPGHVFGEKHGMSKLTETQVLQIRSSEGSLRSLAKMFGVSSPVISDIKNGKTWKHLLKEQP
jgi:hypothetical protein